MIDKIRNKLNFLKVRNTDPITSLRSAQECEESGDTAILANLIPQVLGMAHACRGLTTRQICRTIRDIKKGYYERDSVSPQMRTLERLGIIKATRIVRKDPFTNRFVIVWALPGLADIIMPQGDNEKEIKEL